MAGVCGGLAEYFKVDANLVRLIFVVMTICWGIGIPMYLFAWLIIPREGDARSIGENLVSRVDQVPPAAPNGN
jgi:phage shock protein PspC (stress-responsive transcriptional regulator)